MENTTQYKDMLQSVKTLHKVEIKTVSQGDRKAEVLILPEGKKAECVKPFLDAYLTAPERRKGTAIVTQLDSFVDHLNRFKDEDSVIFANNDMKNPSLTGIIDYHKKTYEGNPRFCEHRTHYKFPLSKEWIKWLAFDGEAFTQGDFAAFLEDRVGDVIYPDEAETDEKLAEIKNLLGGNFAGASKLMALSKNLSINESSKVKQATNLASGESSLVYETQHTDETGAPVNIPNMFLIALPLFVGGDPYRVVVRLRYRHKQGLITWFYNLYRIEDVFEHAFDEACNKVKEATGLPLFLGSPE